MSFTDSGNILNNAVKYTSEGGVTLRIRTEDEREKKLNLVFEIEDTGIGIRSEDKKRIFEKFEKFDTNKNKSIEGTGLGMSIVKALVERMNGTIEIESTYGQGTTVIVKIPQVRVDDRNIGPMDRGFLEENSEMGFDFYTQAKILLVDDSEINLQVTAGLLEKYAIKADLAESGRQAVDMVQSNHYDLVFMDHMMPEMDGVEAMHMIRALGKPYQKLKIVALTANAIMGAKEQMIREGFDGYLTKPINIIDLEKVLLQMIPEDLIEKTVQAEVKNEAYLNEFYELQGCMKHFDAKEGLEKCGGKLEDYKQILRIVYEGSKKRIEELQRYLEDENFERYTIIVHSIKSTFASVGAMELSELARKHEMAGKGKEYDYIRGTWQYLYDMHQMCIFEIGQALGVYEERKVPMKQDTDKKESSDEVRSLLKNLGALIEEFELDKAEEILDELESSNLTAQDRENVEKVSKLLEELNLQEIQRFIENL